MQVAYVRSWRTGVSVLGWLVIGLLITQAPYSALVLCFGSNGHMAVEPMHTPSQSPASQPHGDPCLDLPVFIADADAHAMMVVPRPAPHITAPALTTAMLPVTLEHVLMPVPFVSYGMAVPPPRLESLHTVILLI